MSATPKVYIQPDDFQAYTMNDVLRAKIAPPMRYATLCLQTLLEEEASIRSRRKRRWTMHFIDLVAHPALGICIVESVQGRPSATTWALHKARADLVDLEALILSALRSTCEWTKGPLPIFSAVVMTHLDRLECRFPGALDPSSVIGRSELPSIRQRLVTWMAGQLAKRPAAAEVAVPDLIDAVGRLGTFIDWDELIDVPPDVPAWVMKERFEPVERSRAGDPGHGGQRRDWHGDRQVDRAGG